MLRMAKCILTERNEPKERVVAENSAEVLAESAIIRFASMECVVVFTTLFTEFYRCVLVADEVNVEAEEC